MNAIEELNLSEYKVEGTNEEWEKALKQNPEGLVSIASKKRKVPFQEEKNKKAKKEKKHKKRS